MALVLAASGAELLPCQRVGEGRASRLAVALTWCLLLNDHEGAAIGAERFAKGRGTPGEIGRAVGECARDERALGRAGEVALCDKAGRLEMGAIDLTAGLAEALPGEIHGVGRGRYRPVGVKGLDVDAPLSGQCARRRLNR